MFEVHPISLQSSHCIVYPYDAHFVKAYHGLLDNISRVMVRHHIDPSNEKVEEYFSHHVILDLLVDRLRNQHDFEESIVEGIFEDYEEAAAQDIIEELANFSNLGLYPYGLEEIVKGIDKYIFLIDVVFDEDSDGIYYLFDDPERQ